MSVEHEDGSQRSDALNVFLSYDRDDTRKAQAFVTALQDKGFSVWWDGLIGGGSAFADEDVSVAGAHYAGTQPQNSKNTASVSQYDIACAHQPQ